MALSTAYPVIRRSRVGQRSEPGVDVPVTVDEPPSQTPLAPEPAVPLEPKLKPDAVLVLGGMGSLNDPAEDKFFQTVKSVAPEAMWLPYHGVEKTTGQLRNLIKEDFRNKRVLIIGHSLGATILNNVMNEEGSKLAASPDVDAMYVDPPYNAPWKYAPNFMSYVSPIATAINKSSENGIAYDPATTFAWTRGKTVMYGPNPAHSPWNNLNYPGNAQRVQGFINALKGKISGNPIIPPSLQDNELYPQSVTPNMIGPTPSPVLNVTPSLPPTPVTSVTPGVGGMTKTAATRP